MAIGADPLPLTPDSVKAASRVIEQYIHRTPLLTSQTLNKAIGTPSNGTSAAPKVCVYLKCENFQKIGAFKARGAHHALIRLIDRLGIEQIREKGVVTHSSGELTLHKMLF
jgi:threonine dehydratase